SHQAGGISCGSVSARSSWSWRWRCSSSGRRSFRSSAPAWDRPSRASRRASTRSRSPRRKRSFLRPRRTARPLRITTRWMSLRLQLVLLFTAVLAATLLVASALGLRIGQRSVEEEIRKRTAELASATTLALKHAGNDDDQISEELAATVRTHRGILRAEVARQAALGIDADFTAARIEGGGIVFTRWRGPAIRVADAVIDDPDSGRALRLVAPFNDARGTKARLVLLASLAEAEHLVAAERKALRQVAPRRDLPPHDRLAALGQLAGTIAHDLGNPLNALSSHLQLLARRPDLAEPARSQVAVLQGEVTRMTQIIRRFLDQTRGFTPAAETVELAPLVDEALDLTLGMEARQRIQIAREVDGVAVRTDPGLVRHLLTNLVANAVDAMPNGGRLEVQARSEGR